MTIDPKSTIAGLPALDTRKIIQKLRPYEITITLISRVLNISFLKAKE